ncbi:MAG: hypothetical protein JNM76_04230 [Betaproteobacteria bacterium]|nr:hypothetical protein [Betaproteobacteria bacterium]
MTLIRALFIRIFRHWPAMTVVGLVAVILILEAPGGAADFEPLSLRPYTLPTAQPEPGYAALSHPPMPAAGA